MSKFDTVPIMYHGGTYGTYLEWCLTTLTSDIDIVSPFTSLGNSHGFSGNMLRGPAAWQTYSGNSKFVRFHPRISESESLSTNINSVLSSARRGIYLYPDPGSVVLSVNNAFYKVWLDQWQQYFAGNTSSYSSKINPEVIYTNWPVDRSVPITDIPAWIRREFLSYYFMPAWQSQVEWNHLAHWQADNCSVVLVGDLLHDFENTMQQIQNKCELEFTRPIAELLPYHEINLKKQKHITHDQLCNRIVNLDEDLDWEDCPLGMASEFWIQWELRNRGFEMRCDGLDIFPTNSVQLRELLYQP